MVLLVSFRVLALAYATRESGKSDQQKMLNDRSSTLMLLSMPSNNMRAVLSLHPNSVVNHMASEREVASGLCPSSSALVR